MDADIPLAYLARTLRGPGPKNSIYKAGFISWDPVSPLKPIGCDTNVSLDDPRIGDPIGFRSRDKNPYLSHGDIAAYFRRRNKHPAISIPATTKHLYIIAN